MSGGVSIPYRPVTAGYALEASADASLTLTGQAAGSLRFGFEYKSGQFNAISDHDMSFDADPPKFPYNVYGSLQVYLNPVMVIEVDFIGGR
jgi:hypothetical protein